MKWLTVRILTAVIVMALGIAILIPPAPSDAAPVGGPYESSEVYTTSTTCSNTSALRSAADLLDDGWQAAVAADSYEVGQIGANAPQSPTPNPTTISYTSTATTVDVSKYDVPVADAASAANSSWGTVDISSASDPFLATSATLQDCAPRPSSLYASSSAARPVLWNATAGDGSSLDAVMFEFSSPVAAFGAWFGDIESRLDGEGLPAYLKLFDANGDTITVIPLTPDRAAPIATDPSGRTECGGPQNDDALACGNQATKFIGFSYDQAIVAKMLIVVGEDDSCDEFPNNCEGNTEHLSFVGPQLAVFEPSTLTLAKTVANDHDGTAVPADFDLLMDSSVVTHDVANQVAAGPVAIDEQQLEGYELNGVTCADQDDNPITATPVDPTGFEVDIDLSTDVTCTFANSDIEPMATTTTIPTTTAAPTTTISTTTAAPTTTVAPSTTTSSTAAPTTLAPTTTVGTTTTLAPTTTVGSTTTIGSTAAPTSTVPATTQSPTTERPTSQPTTSEPIATTSLTTSPATSTPPTTGEPTTQTSLTETTATSMVTTTDRAPTSETQAEGVENPTPETLAFTGQTSRSSVFGGVLLVVVGFGLLVSTGLARRLRPGLG